jgi:hypothetical protein
MTMNITRNTYLLETDLKQKKLLTVRVCLGLIGGVVTIAAQIRKSRDDHRASVAIENEANQARLNDHHLTEETIKENQREASARIRAFETAATQPSPPRTFTPPRRGGLFGENPF